MADKKVRASVIGLMAGLIKGHIEFRPDPGQGYPTTLYFSIDTDTAGGVHTWVQRRPREDKRIALIIEDFDPVRPAEPGQVSVAGNVVGVAHPPSNE